MFAKFYHNVVNNRRSDAFQTMNRIFKNKYITGYYSDECMRLINLYIEMRISKEEFQEELVKLRRKFDRYEYGIDYLYQNCYDFHAFYGTTRQEFLEIINEHYKDILDKYVNDATLRKAFLDKACKRIEKMELRKRILTQLVMDMYIDKEFRYLTNNVDLYFGVYFNKYLSDIEYTLPMLLHEMELKHNDIMKSYPHKHRGATTFPLPATPLQQ